MAVELHRPVVVTDGGPWLAVTADCVVCPVCAFTFDASHTDSGNDDLSGYTCPCCTELRTRPLAEAAQAIGDSNFRHLEQFLRKGSWGEAANRVQRFRKLLEDWVSRCPAD